MSQFYDAIVIGGGVNGGSVAYQLAKRGKKVLVLEKDRIASKASGAAAGMIAAQAELQDDDPLFQLARKSRKRFASLAEELKDLSGVDIELINKGMYKVALTDQEVHEYKQIIDIQKRAGEHAEWVTGDEVRKQEANVSDDILGAMYIEHDGHVSAPQLSQAFIKSAAVLGVTIQEFVEVQSILFEGEQVVGVATNEGEYKAENIIVTAGAWSSSFLRQTELDLPVYPVKGECFSVRTHQPLLKSTIFSHGCYLVPKKGGRIIVGATVKPHTYNQQVSVEGVAGLLEKAKHLLPSIGEAEWDQTWAGIRPQTADGLPYLGEHPTYNGLFVATGHFRNGILLSPITGEIMADLIERKEPAIDVHPFRLDRLTATNV
ncbi:glycine oxidase ThiO [Salinibacillus xinjiangensis]|uniref:glycine oxidase n=1 Tax=Salinibacillus xinjiangensis TaxID=1229268 RepID=A0A6G1X5B2_9BACI|nr:glycine oxidase ThiO [Salinibacillus xinjiangensis]MRG86154.1 glycine oxidase ThiO [Salinibacillus xinjiangensis]